MRYKLSFLFWLLALSVGAQIPFPTVVKQGSNVRYLALSTTTPPVDTSYSHTVRYQLARNAYKVNISGYTVGDSVTTLIAQKGTSMPFAQYSKPLLGYPYYTAEGLLYFPNTASCGYKITTTDPPILREAWIVVQNSNYFEYEGIENQYDCFYVGTEGVGAEGAKGIRFQSNSTLPDTAWRDTSFIFSQNKPYIIRYQVLSLPSPDSGFPEIRVSINGTSLGYFYTSPIKSNTFGIGTDGPANPGDAQGANVAQMGIYEYLEFPPLTDAQAASVTSELLAAYPTTVTQYPFASNITISYSGGNTVANYTYNGGGVAEDVSKRVVRYINSTNPTVSEYIGPPQNSLTLTGQTLTNGRVEITCYDINGKSLGIPQSVTIGT